MLGTGSKEVDVALQENGRPVLVRTRVSRGSRKSWTLGMAEEGGAVQHGERTCSLWGGFN